MLLAMRKFWSSKLYPRLRDEYEEALDSSEAPTSAEEVQSIVEDLPSMGKWAWLDRHIQDRLWENVARMVEERSDRITACLEPRSDDLGSLTLETDMTYPKYYEEIDFHRQKGGIWRDDAGAAIYAMGARVIHIGKNDTFGLHDIFARDLETDPPAHILDLACGFGKTTFSLKKKFPDAYVEGIDLSAPCLRLGRRMATENGLEINWRQGDIEKLPYDDASFDILTTTMTLHELPLESIANSLSEAARVLKPGGVLVALENPLVGEPLRDLLTHYHSQIILEPFHFDFRRADMEKYLMSAGFGEASSKAWFPFGNKPGIEKDLRNWVTPWCWYEAIK